MFGGYFDAGSNVAPVRKAPLLQSSIRELAHPDLLSHERKLSIPANYSVWKTSAPIT